MVWKVCYIMIIFRFFKKRFIILSFCIFFGGALFHYLLSSKMEFVKYNIDNKFLYFKIQDYAYHILITKSFWFENFGDIYKLDFQQKVLSTYLGSDISLAMPLGITPVAMVVWLPFAFIAKYDMALSYTFWSISSITLLFLSLWKFLKKRCQENKSISLPFYLVVVTIYSPAAFVALLLGQTSIFAVGLIVLIIDYIFEKNSKPKNFFAIAYIAILVFMIGIKPSYLLIIFGLLAIYGLWKELFLSGFLMIGYFIAFSLLLGIEWIFSYKNLMEMYTSGVFPNEYSWSIVPGTMNIFRSAFRNLVGDSFAVLISSSVTLAVYFIVFCYSIMKSTNFFGKEIKFERSQVFILLVSSYLLFAPYAGSYEDVLFIPIFLVLLISYKMPNAIDFKGFILILLLFFLLSQIVFSSSEFMLFFWLMKFVFIWFLIIYCILASNVENIIINIFQNKREDLSKSSKNV